jgi:hypothetical protein
MIASGVLINPSKQDNNNIITNNGKKLIYVEAILNKYTNFINIWDHEKLIVVWGMISNSRYQYMIMDIWLKAWV